MKAITKTNREFEVRFCELNLSRFRDAARQPERYYDKYAMILIKGNWYRCNITFRYIDNILVDFVELSSKEACNALNVKYEFLRPTLIRVYPNSGTSIAKEWADNYSKSLKKIQAEADSIEFNTLKINCIGGDFYVYAWDGNADRCYAEFNSQAKEMLLSLCLAYYAGEGKLDKYVTTTPFFKDWTIKKSDIARINEIAAPVREKYETNLRRKEFEKKQKSEMEANIAAGAVYFHCESQPHDEDLSNVVLNRPCPNRGLYTLMHRVDTKTFSLIKKFGSFWDEDFLDQCDMFMSEEGWRFSCDAINSLRKHNIRVFVDYTEID